MSQIFFLVTHYQYPDIFIVTSFIEGSFTINRSFESVLAFMCLSIILI